MKEEENHHSINELARLKWACRRGMLELDVILGNFVEQTYHHLSETNKRNFQKLLNQSDPELFNWLLGFEIPSDEDLAEIVEIVRHAQSRI